MLHYYEVITDCKLYISTPTLRSDNGKVTLTENQLNNNLLQLNIDIVDDRNITSKNLSWKNLNLNESGSRRFPTFFLERIKKF